MLDMLLTYFHVLLKYIELATNHLLAYSAKWPKYRDTLSDSLDGFNRKLRGISPFTLVAGSLIAFVVLRWFVKKFIKLWTAISKLYVNFRLNRKNQDSPN